MATEADDLRDGDDKQAWSTPTRRTLFDLADALATTVSGNDGTTSS